MNRLSIPTRSIIGIIVAYVLYAIARYYGNGERHTFGYPNAVDVALVVLLWALFLTQIIVAIIIWLQRERWLPSDAAMFRDVAIIALVWLHFASTHQSLGRGVTLGIATLYVWLVIVTGDLLIRLTRRYIFWTSDEREYPEWDRISERRGPEPGRRWTDGTP